MSEKLKIKGGKALKGTVKISGSKNAVLPILAASLLISEGETVLTNVPDISDVKTMLGLMEYLGAKTERNGETVKINAEKLENKILPHHLVSRMRASILFLAPLLGRFGKAEIDFPGGCVLGKRPTTAHEKACEAFGMKNESDSSVLKFSGNLSATDFVMQEPSVTATENAIMLACATEGESIIRLAAAEPHVQDLCEMLVKAGVKIEGIGGNTLKINGAKNLSGLTHNVRGDYLELGTWAIIAAVTGGEIKITGGEFHDLDSFWQKMNEAGVKYEVDGNDVTVYGTGNYKQITKLDTGIHPKFPTDLQAPFGVLLTQCEGRNRIFETLFDGRLAYLYELEKMGAEFEMLNSHQAIVYGATPLRGAEVSSLDIRAGAAMVVAGLAAKGETIVHDVKYFYRGYDNFTTKVRALGGEIEEIKSCEC